jgi:arylsulfatase A-like enzyme
VSPTASTCTNNAKNKIKEVKAATPDECCAACDSNTKCASWTQWDGDNCNLFSTAEGFHDGDCTSGGVPPAPDPPQPGPACTDCPNIILMLTDDQDLVLGGWNTTDASPYDPMRQVRARVEAQGVNMAEWRIHTPICAPSRAELQSGRYYQNIASDEATPSPKVSGGAVGQIDLSGKVWPFVFPTLLRQAKGYVTAEFAKCMNGGCGSDGSGGKGGKDLHMMGAFDRWFEATGYTDSTFFDTEADGCAWPWDTHTQQCQTKTSAGGKWAGRGDGYDTATVGNVTVEWLRKVAGAGRPFFVYFAPHAPHSPATPAPWYEKGTRCDGATSPRTPAFDYKGNTSTARATHAPAPRARRSFSRLARSAELLGAAAVWGAAVW